MLLVCFKQSYQTDKRNPLTLLSSNKWCSLLFWQEITKMKSIKKKQIRLSTTNQNSFILLIWFYLLILLVIYPSLYFYHICVVFINRDSKYLAKRKKKTRFWRKNKNLPLGQNIDAMIFVILKSCIVLWWESFFCPLSVFSTAHLLSHLFKGIWWNLVGSIITIRGVTILCCSCDSLL